MPGQSSSFYKCEKCGSRDYETGEIRTAGGLLSSLFDFNSERFAFISCTSCHHTDFYRARLSQLSQFVDFLS